LHDGDFRTAGSLDQIRIGTADPVKAETFVEGVGFVGVAAGLSPGESEPVG